MNEDDFLKWILDYMDECKKNQYPDFLIKQDVEKRLRLLDRQNSDFWSEYWQEYYEEEKEYETVF